MENKGNRKYRKGIITSACMDKSVVILVERTALHPKYHKYIKRSKKLMAHDECNECKVGDIVEIAETRPLSKRKHWNVLRIVERPVGVSE